MTKIQDAVQEVSDACTTPEDFAAFCALLAEKFQDSASELRAAYGDREAGCCWVRVARKLDAIAAQMPGWL